MSFIELVIGVTCAMILAGWIKQHVEFIFKFKLKKSDNKKSDTKKSDNSSVKKKSDLPSIDDFVENDKGSINTHKIESSFDGKIKE